MMYFFIVLAFVVGYFLGVFTVSLLAINGEKSRRAQIEDYEAENERLQSDVNMYKHRVGDAMSEVAHIRSQYNKARAELEFTKKGLERLKKNNGSDKRPTKKHNVKSNGGGARKGEKRRKVGNLDVCDSLH